jgi:signal transduction histidine kinase
VRRRRFIDVLLSRGVIELHGGTVLAESAGATFVVLLPLTGERRPEA